MSSAVSRRRAGRLKSASIKRRFAALGLARLAVAQKRVRRGVQRRAGAHQRVDGHAHRPALHVGHDAQRAVHALGQLFLRQLQRHAPRMYAPPGADAVVGIGHAQTPAFFSYVSYGRKRLQKRKR